MNKIIELLANIPLLPQVLYQNQSNESESSRPRNTLFNSFSSQSICNLTQQSPKSPPLETNAAQIKSLQQQITADDAAKSQSSPESSNAHSSSITDNSSVVVLGEAANLSLLDWIKSFDPQHQLDNVINETREMMTNFEKNFDWPALQARKNELLKTIEQNQNMREIEE